MGPHHARMRTGRRRFAARGRARRARLAAFLACVLGVSGAQLTVGHLALGGAAPSGSGVAAPATSGTPVILDDDMFSDADGVGGLATAFALQLKGEANVLAIGVDTRTSRAAVATNSWKCVAAIAQFYGFGSVPIGSDMPDNGTAVNSPDMVGPCAALASPSTPSPTPAVGVFRNALASASDNSVVMIGTGYEENLSALLDSPADSISPLDGHDLIAQKVKRLVLMGGGYPSRNGETNFQGDPASAQDVANNWPTKVVYSGFEVGDAVHTGDTISSVHPADSPVRVAYEAFVGSGNWIQSYDLTAVYHAIRPNDALLTEVGPGTNAITGTGKNTFTTGSGNEFYLTLANPTALDSAIESLLDVLPASSPTTTTSSSTTTTSTTTTSTTTTTTTTTLPPTTTTTSPPPTTTTVTTATTPTPTTAASAPPGAPTGVTATSNATTAGAGALTVRYRAGASNGATITKFTATCTSRNGGGTRTAAHEGSAPAAIKVGGLRTAKTYSCTVRATNARGVGPMSTASLPVVVGAPGAPHGSHPVRVAVGTFKVFFSSGANNGARITSYVAVCTSTNGGVTRSRSGAASPITVSGLTPGKSYTCKVRATNRRGTGSGSSASAVVHD